jgi:ketosteroid isomerase-like protein
MRNLFLILILFLAASTLSAAGQTLHREASVTGKDKREVMKLERRWDRAFLRRDIKTLSHLMADDYVGTSSKGEVENKAQTLMSIKATAPHFVSFDNDEVEARFYGDIAIVTGRLKMTVLYESQEVSGQFRYTRVYVERRKHWLLIVSHTNKVAQ